MSEIKVSIRCTVYNHEKYLKKCLDGFIMQKTNFLFEVIVHDDASTDNSAEIIREYEKKYPNIIKPIYQTENQYSKGIPISKTFVDPHCKGAYWAICEGDDYWTDENKLQKQYDFMVNNPNCSICAHGAMLHNQRTNRITFYGPGKNAQYYTPDQVILGGGGFVATNTLFLKREVAERMPACFACEGVGDYQLQMHGAMVGDFYYMPESMAVYNMFSSPSAWTSQISKARNAKRAQNIEKMLTCVNAHYNGKYANAIERKILINTFNINLENGNYQECKKEIYKEVYKHDGFVRKTLIKVQIYCPWLIRLVNKLRGKA